MKSTCTYLCLAVVVASLAACGGGGGPETSAPTPAASTTTVHQYSLAGNVSASSISATASGGQFEIAWDVSSSDPFVAAAYLSGDGVVSQDDRQFLGANCGESDLYACKARQTIQCNLVKATTSETPSYTLSCQNSKAAVGGVTLAGINLPYSGNIVFHACNALLTSCKTISQPITLLP